MGRRIVQQSLPTFSHENSIDFDGLSETMRSNASTLNIANSWTVAMWLKPEGAFTVSRVMMQIAVSGTSQDKIQFQHFGNLVNDPLDMSLANSAGTNIKQYRYNNILQADIWQHLVATWDGTIFKTWYNATLLVPDTISIDSSGTQSGSSRVVAIGGTTSGTLKWTGRAHSLALWDTPLSAEEITTIYAGGDGSTSDIRNVKPNNLKHWWNLGFAGDIGKDIITTNPIDVNANSLNITEADDAIVDAP